MTNSQPRVFAIIPARYASQRFPGKPLTLIHNKPMIQHVWERVKQVSSIQKVVVATDDNRIVEAVRAFGGDVQMTSHTHASGTDRVWEVAQTEKGFDWILNVQGDEPAISPQDLTRIIEGTQQFPTAHMLTLVTPFWQPGRNLAQAQQDWQNPNVVKAVMSQHGQALYFSRASIPVCRDQDETIESQLQKRFRHIGVYLYRRSALEHITSLPVSSLEQQEKLEQLRALEASLKIYGVKVDEAPTGIDTPDDLARFLKRFPQAVSSPPAG